MTSVEIEATEELHKPRNIHPFTSHNERKRYL